MFNTQSREVNTAKSSVASVINQIVSLLVKFVYRTVFLMVLSIEYLGVNSLFTSVIGLFSLAELGICTAIIYRMYKPVADGDVEKVAALMLFYKRAYHIIALVVAVVGLIILPFINFFINEGDVIPADINIYVVYLMFLAQSVASYLFVYKQSIINVDQKTYVISIFNVVFVVLQNALLILVLLLTKNYMLTLILSIVTTIALNFLFSLYITKKYLDVFKLKNKLSREESRAILKDTGAMMCHKAGGVALTSTDSILISYFISVAILGIYSNYTLVISSITVLFLQILNAACASIGNHYAHGDIESFRKVYWRINYFHLVITSFCAICLYSLVNPFILVWLGADMVLDEFTVIMISLCFVLNSRACNGIFISATGLFVRDKLRPLIEIALKVGVSIPLVIFLGLPGIFIGTIVSNIFTVFWREPYLLFKYGLKLSMKKYWLIYMCFFIFTVAFCTGFRFLLILLPGGLTWFLLKAVIVILGSLGLLTLATFWTSEFKYYRSLFGRLLRKLFKRKTKAKDDVGQVND